MANTAILPVRRKAGTPRFPGPLLAAALLLLLGGGAAAPARAAPIPGPAPLAFAQEAPAGDASALVSLDRLKFEYKCYFNIPEWRGKGEAIFLKKLAEQKEAYKAKKSPGVAALEGMMAEGYWKLKGECEARGDVDGADAMAKLITELESETDKVVAEFIDKANAFLIGRNFEKAKKMEAAGNVAEARKAFALIVNAKDRAIGQQAVSAIVRIVRGQRNFQAVMESNDLADIGAMLEAVLADLKGDLGANFESFLKGSGGYAVNADLKAIDDEKTRNAGSTQSIQVAWRDVSAALAGVKGKIEDVSAATFRLEPEGAEGVLFPAKGASDKFKKNPFLWHRGVYTLRAYAPGSDRPFASIHGLTMKDAMASVEFPSRVPEGMVWCPPLKAGGEALFVDRYEVTVAEVEAAAAGDEALAESARESRGFSASVTDRHPAWFFKAEALEAFEKATGKRVPTDAQWLQAAFGGTDAASHPFPWGKEGPDGTRAFTVGGRDYPEAVGGRPAGASPCGAEDMAGNVAEWVRKGGKLWLLGGNYTMVDGQLAAFHGKFPLRDPMPAKAAFDAMDSNQQNDYFKYKFNEVDEGYLVGLRTVVPVPAK